MQLLDGDALCTPRRKGSVNMTVTPTLFEAYLRCPSTCFLRSKGEQGAGNAYADWVRAREKYYRTNGIQRLQDGLAPGESVTRPALAGKLKSAKWRVALEVRAHSETCEATIPALERVPTRQGGSFQLIPIRFTSKNKITLDDKLLSAFDASVLSEQLRLRIDRGKIIHGDTHAHHTVDTARLMTPVSKVTNRIAALLAADAPPALRLNRHCAECECQRPLSAASAREGRPQSVGRRERDGAQEAS